MVTVALANIKNTNKAECRQVTQGQGFKCKHVSRPKESKNK